MTAIGFIETYGLIPAIEAADAMLKAADVRILERNQVGSGLVTITVSGSVSAVQASVDAAAGAIGRIEGGVLVSKHVIARADEGISTIIATTPIDSVVEVSEVAAEAELVTESIPAVSAPESVVEGIAPESTRYTVSALKKMTVAELRRIARSLGGAKVKSSKKKDLIEIIVNIYRKVEE